jgi:predicted dehydrogenase
MKTTLLPNFRNVKEALGRIGRVRCYNSSFCQYSSRFAAFLSGGPVANVFNPAMHGGSLRDLGVYCIAPMIHLFGVPWEGEYTMEKMLEHVSVTPMMMTPGDSADPSQAIDVQGSMVVSYPGMLATVTWSKACDGAWGTQILGEDGTIEIAKTSTMISPRIRLRSGVGDAGLRKGTDEWEDLSTPTPDFMYPEVKEFFDLIESGRIESTVNTHQRSLDTARIVDSLYRAG